MNIFAVPIDQILARDGGNGGVLGDPGVGIVRAVGEFESFTVCDFADLIITPRDTIERFFLSDIEFVSAELGIAEQVQESLEDIVKVALQA